MMATSFRQKGSKAVLGGTAALLLAGTLASAPARADWEVSGNIGVVSDYVLRGITAETESDGPAVQGGLDFETDLGFYAGWWASSLGYGTDDLTTTIENDLYAGFGGEVGPLSYDIGVVYYYYMDDSDSSGFEPYLGLGLGPVSFGLAYLAEDVSWGNQGDMYITLGADFDIPMGFGLSLLAGHYIYEDSGDFIPSTEKSSAFRHLDVTLSRQIGETPATMFATYTVGGEDRDGNSQTDKIVIGFNYDFSIK